MIFVKNPGDFHLLPLAEAETSCKIQLSDQIFNPGNDLDVNMTPIPQTTWDLFFLLQRWKSEYPIKNSTDIKVLNHPMSECLHFNIQLNNAFITMILHYNLSEDFNRGNFTAITNYLFTCIHEHLVEFNKQSKAYAKLGEDTPQTCFSQLALLFFFKDLYPEIPALLERATKIEADLLRTDQLPLWRHAYCVETAPLVRTEKSTIQVRTRSYGYSLLACCLGDGTFDGISQYNGNFSACAFSYYAQILRDRAFIKKNDNFPYYVPGQLLNSADEIKKTLETITGDNLTCTIIEKKHHKDLFYLPTVYSNVLVDLKGDDCHPRSKGTVLHAAEQSGRSFNHNNIPKSQQEPKALADKLLELPCIWVTLNGSLIQQDDQQIKDLETQRLQRIKDEDLPKF
ncbi:MAG: hypothetical protein COY39_02000 [Alphaproteobacteria bacterium CG_4_10_14_0_8_um_filter_37_21]|nr:MAG: hypothetical protein COY39_02000 [Alphaproteobacteria bacterium CG_4_10_14_0_8_um_filter_37_21]